MLKGFELLFHQFWYIDGWVSVPDLMRPICNIGKFGQRSTHFAPNWVFFEANWYSDGSQNHTSRYRDGQLFEAYTLSIYIHVNVFECPFPPPRAATLTCAHIFAGCASIGDVAAFMVGLHIYPCQPITNTCKMLVARCLHED